MTNQEIIFQESIKLMKNGILKGTGEFVTIQDEQGKRDIELPEEIHTFQHWKQLGYQVKKGEKAKAQFSIWKHTVKMLDENTDNEAVNKMNKNINIQGGKTSMFMKLSSFFTVDQVEKIELKNAN